MKIIGYCLAVVALFVLVKLAVIAAGFATGYYLFHVRTPRPHVIMKDIEPSASAPSHVTMRHIERSSALPLACTAAPTTDAPTTE